MTELCSFASKPILREHPYRMEPVIQTESDSVIAFGPSKVGTK